jgi:hypothetical protein
VRYTADELVQGIARAIKAKDFAAVRDLLHALAVVSPRDAQTVVDAIDTARFLSD